MRNPQCISVSSGLDYYPFGSVMPGRSYTGNGYRYGFNGKEKDDEVRGSGNSLDFGARIYDNRLGRWLSADPLQSKYPDLSPYNFSGSSPILFVDLDGRKFVNPYHKMVAESQQKLQSAQSLYDEFLKNNPNAKPRDIKKSQEAQNLASAQKELEQNQTDAKKVDDFIFTLKESNKSEHDYFEDLKDGNGNEIDIVVTVAHKQGAFLGNGRINGETEIAPTIYKGIYGVQDNKIIVTLYEATNLLTGENAGYQTYRTFANELGDIQYYFNKVKDEKSYEVWVESARGDSPNYNSKEGAGEYSRQYSTAREADVKKTGKKTDESGCIER